MIVKKAPEGAVMVSSDLRVHSDRVQPKMLLALGREGAVQVGDLTLKIAVHQISGRSHEK